MTSAEFVARPTDPNERWFVRLGGLAGLLIGLGYIVIIPLYVAVGPPPDDAEAWLRYAAGKTTVWWAILGLSVVTDILFIPLALALVLALRTINRPAMLLAAAFIALFVVLDLAVTWTNYAALITLSDAYAGATTDAQRSAAVTAAGLAVAVLGSTLEAVFSIVTLSIGILITGLVMLQSTFGKAAAYVGVLTGVAGIVSVAGSLLGPSLSVTAIVASLLTTLWLLIVGVRLAQVRQ